MATLSTAERRAINLTWAKPFDGNSPLLRYVLEMSENSKPPRPSQLGAQILGVGPGPGSSSPASQFRAFEQTFWKPQLPCEMSIGMCPPAPVIVTVAHDGTCEGRGSGTCHSRASQRWRFFAFYPPRPQAVNSKISRPCLNGVLNTVCLELINLRGKK